MDFGMALINWYQLNKRVLPWRNTRNPYLIWLSEIILQQTRVAQGMPYYYRFEERFPNITSFANASEDEVLKLWQGLGYYSRARNMLKTAQEIKNNYAGVFPTAYADLIKLKGLGPYTAAAISSFSVDEKRAVVDGNVYRVLARYIGIDKPINTSEGVMVFQKLANTLIENHVPSQYNQAIMEFGALVCTPKKPACNHCVLRLTCWAFTHHKIAVLPVKLKKNPPKKRFMYFFVVPSNNKLIIKRRSNADIWAGLYDFPSIESDSPQTVEAIIADTQFKTWFGPQVVVHKIYKPIKHLLTHQTIYATFIELLGSYQSMEQPKEWLYVPINEVENYAQPKLIFAFLKNYLT
ncbi:MAG: A/G-specific adenine glycosylase [Sphingobacteriales bacterium]|jgi:A/G-specific adenine glycosylase|nr:MAG: A/G-specific adenine glycosylase [Sphingobacteriales bacterium]